ncbi:hypothetical protein BaRGS_00006076 [Batillaria attramentaria]|uniref:SAM domain-containing protein n=1 Tax=Batillaria attramentaria TaxID=370345 RepID=A0ABD0LTJ7_9CAEN|nr:hypothetical protein BaRGS_035081 [Batillaria attramentaria]
MKANSNFRDQVGQVTNWFKEWSECEQTVALYSLLKKLSPAQAKFLDQVLQQSLADCTDVKQLQKKANDEAFVAGLCGEDKGKVILQLLQLLPLLEAGNEKAKAEYLKLIPDVLSHTIDNGVNIEESRQLLSYSLIHPAITQEERSKFRMWLGYLEERFTYNISHTRPLGNAQDSLTATFAPVSASHSQDGLNNLLGGTASASPSISTGNGWHNHGHTTHFGVDGGAVSSGGLGDGGAGGSSLLPNGHLGLRATNSHAGAFSVHNGHMPLHATSSAPPNFDTMAASVSQSSTNQPNPHMPLRRTTSIVHGNPLPLRVQNPEKTVTDWLQMHPAVDNAGGLVVGRGRSPSLTDHAPLSPQSSVTSSGSGGSDSHHDDGPQPVRDSFLEEGSGMRDVPVWLKTLRLHKYSYLFRQMTYEEMLSITEEWLEAQKVTKGARHKIVISIQKLRERQQQLRDFEKHIMEGGPIREVLGEMKSMLNTPIKAYTPPQSGSASSHPSPPQSPSTDSDIAEGNLPGQFVRLMGKACTQLLTASVPDDDSIQLYFQLIDKCLNHEAFSQRQKSLLSSWKQQAQKIWQPPPHKYDRRQKSTWGNTFPLNTVAARGSGSRSRLPPSQPSVQQWSFGSRRSVLGSTNMHTPLTRNSSLNAAILNKPGLMEAKQPVTRTQSAPLRSTHLSLSQPMQSGGMEQATDTEINARLDSLCLSMTEHALGTLDGNDKGSTF